MLDKVRRLLGVSPKDDENEADRLAREAEDAEARRVIAQEDIDKSAKGRVFKIFAYIGTICVIAYVIGISIAASDRVRRSKDRLAAEQQSTQSYQINVTEDLWKLRTEENIEGLQNRLNKTEATLRGDLNASSIALAKELNTSLRGIEAILADMKEENKQANDATKKMVSDINKSTAETLKLHEELIKKEINIKIATAIANNKPVVTPTKELPAPPSKTDGNTTTAKVVQPVQPAPPAIVKEPEIPPYTSVSIADISVATASYKTKNLFESPDANLTLPPKFNLPSGLVRATLVTGADAPVFEQWRSNPHPVLLSIDSFEITANNHETEITDCLAWVMRRGSLV